MQTYTVQTQGVCAKAITFAIEDGKIYDVKFYGGCSGNTSAISKLLEGTEAQNVVKILKGNDCGGRGTSCADQLARGVEQALTEAGVTQQA